MKRTPYTAIDFLWTKWTAEDIKKQVPLVLALKKERLSAIKKVKKGEHTFANTVYAIEASDHGLSEIILKIDLLQNVSPDKNIRDTAKRAIETIENKMIAIERDQKIWEALKDYEATTWKKERAKLGKDDQKLFKDMFLVYRRMGFDLSPEKQKRLKTIEQKLAKLSNEFRHNINSYQDHIVVTEADLADLPPRYREGLKRDKKGNHLVTLAYPDMNPFMEMADNEAKRKELNERYFRKGGEKNMAILKQMLAVRAEHAKLLGYAHHADYQTEIRMAKSGAHASAFNADLLKRIEKSGRYDLDELRDLKRELTKNKKAELYSHDIAYYGQKLQKRRFNFDNEEARAYFPLAHVLKGMFSIYATLFGVHFEKVSDVDLWHIDAELYAVKDTSEKTLAYFALDLHPREGKYGHAAAFGVIHGRASTDDDAYIAPFATMVTNFPKPSEKHPSLLAHSEVETLLHEFGHIMHCVLTTARHSSQAGYHTAWDFVEAPSQMLEHWAWDPKSLAMLSAHHETGEPLPKALLKNLLASRTHLLRYATLRQAILGRFDLDIHMGKKVSDVNAHYKNLVKKHAGITLPKSSLFPAGFGHLDGYDAGYYGYLWSNVFAADMFTRFEKEGILNKKTGNDYKKWILEKGASEDALDLVKGFLGRSPNNKAFLKEIGVK